MSFVIGIAGGTGAGKTTLAHTLKNQFGDTAVLIAHDAYYRDQSHLPPAERAKTNFDAPDALETDLMISHLEQLRSGHSVRIPEYDFATHTRVVDGGRKIVPVPIVIAEGILLLSEPGIVELADLKVFVDTDDDERILRRIRRDVYERGRSVASVMDQYLATVKPMHERYVGPSRSAADLVVNGGGDTAKAVEVIVAHVEARMR